MLDILSVFLNLPCLDFSPKMWSMLQNVPCALRKKVYSAFRWNVLYVSIKFIWSSVSFKTCVSLLTFCSWWSIHWYKWSAKVPHYYYVTVNFPFYVCQCLPYVLRCPNVHKYLQLSCLPLVWGFPGGSAVKNPPAMQGTQETQVQSLGQEDALE